MYMRDFKGWDALTLEKSGGPGQCLRTASGPVRRHDKYIFDVYEFYPVEWSGGSLYTVGSLLIQMGNPLRIATVVNRPVR